MEESLSDEHADEKPPEEKPAAKKFDRSIVEGPLTSAVWKIAWPAGFTNIISGVQGWVDHILVGHLLGYKANAAIGVSFQIFLVVIVFVSSIFIGMSVLVARFAGAGDKEKVDRTVYQGFLTCFFLAIGILAPIGYFTAPHLLAFVTHDATVIEDALPFLRIMFTCSFGMLIYFMLGGALRSAGDAKTPMVLGIAMTVLNLVLNVILIRGLGPIPSFGAAGSAMGTCIASGAVGLYSLYKLYSGSWVVGFPKSGYAPDWGIIRELFRFGLPAGFQGIAMNVGGVLMLTFMGSVANGAAAQAAFTVGYGQLFLLVTWSSNALMGAAGAVVGQNIGAGSPDRAASSVRIASRFGMIGAAVVGFFFLFFPETMLAIFGLTDPAVVEVGTTLLRVLSISGLFITTALSYTGGLQGAGDTKSPLFISIISQVIVPLSICFVIRETSTLEPIHIWVAILAGHVTRCVLSVLRFNQGKWRAIKVNIDRQPA